MLYVLIMVIALDDHWAESSMIQIKSQPQHVNFTFNLTLYISLDIMKIGGNQLNFQFKLSEYLWRATARKTPQMDRPSGVEKGR